MLEGCVVDPMVCDCSCHRDDSIKDMMPCCVVCLYCRQNIKEFYIKLHTEECKKENKTVRCLNCRESVESELLEEHMKKCQEEFRKIIEEYNKDLLNKE